MTDRHRWVCNSCGVPCWLEVGGMVKADTEPYRCALGDGSRSDWQKVSQPTANPVTSGNAIPVEIAYEHGFYLSTFFKEACTRSDLTVGNSSEVFDGYYQKYLAVKESSNE